MILRRWMGLAMVAAALLACAESEVDYYQGYLEVDALELAPAAAGRLERLTVARGDAVRAEQLLASLDGERERAALAEAQGRVQAALARIDDLSSGKRAPERRVVEAQLAQARSGAEQSRREAQRRADLVKRGLLAVEQADAAQSQARADAQRVQELQAQLAVADLPGRQAQIAALQAEHAAALALAEQAAWTLAQRELSSPVDGWVRETWYRPGEWIAAGRPVLSLLPAGEMEVRFFVPTAVAGQLAPGRRVEVSGTALTTPLKGTISHIADQPEYAPPLIFSRDRDDQLLFQVRASLLIDASARLNPGLPVEVRLP
jgi:HlyD family secretion protein